MDPREIQDLIERIERLKAKQAEIEEMQRKMTEHVGTVQKAIVAEEVMLRRILRSALPPGGPQSE